MIKRKTKPITKESCQEVLAMMREGWSHHYALSVVLNAMSQAIYVRAAQIEPKIKELAEERRRAKNKLRGY